MAIKAKFKKNLKYNNIDPLMLPVEEYDLLEKGIINTMVFKTFLDGGLVKVTKGLSKELMFKIPIFIPVDVIDFVSDV